MKLPVNYNKLTCVERRKVREEYIRIQKGVCCYCKAPLKGKPALYVRILSITEALFPKNFFKWPVHLHHSHVTGLTIGAVHSYCNAVSWEYDGE